MKKGHVAIMQPYLFPYISYFHLIEASSIIVFYDDVHYIKRGWINRNRLLNQDRDCLFTVPISKASFNKLINETQPLIDEKWKNKFYKQLTHNYKKSPFFSDVYEMITSVLEKDYHSISDLAVESILAVYKYLDIPINYTRSSECSPNTRGIEKTDRIINIVRTLGYSSYVNASGGKEIYKKECFMGKGVVLLFVNSPPIEYKQYSNTFVPSLSIIDTLMFNEKTRIVELFSDHFLE